jgi:hypothetical protein
MRASYGREKEDGRGGLFEGEELAENEGVRVTGGWRALMGIYGNMPHLAQRAAINSARLSLCSASLALNFLVFQRGRKLGEQVTPVVCLEFPQKCLVKCTTPLLL